MSPHVRVRLEKTQMNSYLPSGPGILRFSTFRVDLNVLFCTSAKRSWNGHWTRFVLQDAAGYAVGELTDSQLKGDEYLRNHPEILGRHSFILLSEDFRALSRGNYGIDEGQYFIRQYVEGEDTVIVPFYQQRINSIRATDT